MSSRTGARDPWMWAGLGVAGVAAMVFSFSALADLARLTGIDDAVEVLGWRFEQAWLLPLVVDVFAVTATRIWLRRRVAAEAARFASRAAWAAIGATIVGNAYHGVLIGDGRVDLIVISAVPAVALGALVHLAVLAGRPASDDAAQGDDERPADPWAALHDDALADVWRAAIATWSPEPARPAEPGGWAPPAGSEPNDVLAADLRAVDAARRAAGLPALARDKVCQRYGVGKTRAETLRDLAAAPPPPPAGRTAVDEPAGEQLVDEPAVAARAS